MGVVFMVGWVVGGDGEELSIHGGSSGNGFGFLLGGGLAAFKSGKGSVGKDLLV